MDPYKPSEDDKKTVESLRAVHPEDFEADYQWYVAHPADERSEHYGRQGESESLYRYVALGHWKRFEEGDFVSIAHDEAPLVAMTLNLKARTFHRFTPQRTEELISHKPYAPSLPAHYDETASIGGKATISIHAVIESLPSATIDGSDISGKRLTRNERVTSLSGRCISGDDFGSLQDYSSQGVTEAYRGRFDEPARAYTFKFALPFTQRHFGVCDRTFADSTPQATASWDEFEHRFLFFERSESRVTRPVPDDGIEVVERGHVRVLDPADMRPFEVPAGFRDDCTTAPRPDDCSS